MALGLVGADADALDQAAAELRAAADDLDGSETALTSLLGSVSWLGPIASAFLDGWSGGHRMRMRSTADFLRDMATTVQSNATAQRDASSGDGPGSSGPGPGPVPIRDGSGPSGPDGGDTQTPPVDRGADDPGDRIPEDANASIGDYLHEVTQLNEGEVALRLVSEGPPPRYVLLLRGLDPGSTGSNSFPSTLFDFFGIPSPYDRHIKSILDGLPADAEIGVIAHSQGGLAATNSAVDDPRITDIITVGSPVDGRPHGDAHLTSIVNSGDPVPYADSLNDPWDGEGPDHTIEFDNGKNGLGGHAGSGYRDYLDGLYGDGGYGDPHLQDFYDKYGGGEGSGAAEQFEAPDPYEDWTPLPEDPDSFWNQNNGNLGA